MRYLFSPTKQIPNTIQGGEYLITDPSYVLPKERWDALCEGIFCTEGFKNGCAVTVHRLDEEPEACVMYSTGTFYWAPTSRGDGVYSVLDLSGCAIGRVGVDSGMIGVFPINVCMESAAIGLIDKGLATKIIINTGELVVQRGLIRVSGFCCAC